jgi:hypothetical protein
MAEEQRQENKEERQHHEQSAYFSLVLSLWHLQLEDLWFRVHSRLP